MTAIGQPITRVDGRAKVTGAAKYAAEFQIPQLAYAVMVTSTVPNGRIQRMETAAAQRSTGVLSIITPANAPKLPQGGKAAVHPPAGRVLSLLQDDLVHYNNQPIAVVVAETLNQALYAASLVRVRYQDQPAQLDFQGGFAAAHPGGHGHDPAEVSAGQLAAGLAEGEVKVDEIYQTPMQNHNPMEPHATIAQWTGEQLTLHDATQYISGVKQTVARSPRPSRRQRARPLPVYWRRLRLQRFYMVPRGACGDGGQGGQPPSKAGVGAATDVRSGGWAAKDAPTHRARGKEGWYAHRDPA